MTFEAADMFDPGRWSRAERQALRDRVDSLLSRCAAACYPTADLTQEIAQAGDDLARLSGIAWDLTTWLDLEGHGTVGDRLWRASLDHD
jgi:hypothetical protein